MNSNLAFAPPVARKTSASAASTSAPSDCECSRTFNLQTEQGQTLSSKIAIKLDGAPVDVTGGEFQFTAKLDPVDADDASTTVKIDWTEVATPTAGITWLVIPADTTADMQTTGYSYQVRYVSSGGIVTPICKGVLTIVQPISSRH